MFSCCLLFLCLLRLRALSTTTTTPAAAAATFEEKEKYPAEMSFRIIAYKGVHSILFHSIASDNELVKGTHTLTVNFAFFL